MLSPAITFSELALDVNWNSDSPPLIDLPVVVLVEYDALVPGTVNDCKFKYSNYDCIRNKFILFNETYNR